MTEAAPTLRELLAVVADAHALPPDGLIARDHRRAVSAARREFYHRALAERRWTCGQIARVIKRDSSTIFYGAAAYAIEHGLEPACGFNIWRRLPRRLEPIARAAE